MAYDALRSQLQGELLEPGSQAYDSARIVWNAAIDRRPGAIARCRNAADVMACVNAARENGLLVAIRAGGHNVAGSSRTAFINERSIIKPPSQTAASQASVRCALLISPGAGVAHLGRDPAGLERIRPFSDVCMFARLGACPAARDDRSVTFFGAAT